MKPLLRFAAAAALPVILGLADLPAQAQVAGRTTVVLGAIEIQAIAIGWSARKRLIGHDVYNEDNEKVGKVDDLIVTPDNAVSFAIVGTGGFVGVRRHRVAIPVMALTPRDGDFLLPGATKELIRSLPAFEYEE
jgi:hypothetical protein